MTTRIRQGILKIMVFACFALTATAAPVLGVTATTALGDFSAPPFNTIQQTVNGTTLTALSLTGRTNGNLGWFANNTGPTGVINYSLNGSYLLSQLGFWNAENGNQGFGLRDVRIETSVNGVTYTALTGAGFVAGVRTFAQGTAGTSNLPQVVAFTPVLASFVRFTVTSNYNSGSYPGYQAVVFDGVPVPEIDVRNGQVPICITFLLLLILSDRRRSHARFISS